MGFLLVDRSSQQGTPDVERVTQSELPVAFATEADTVRVYDSIAVLPFANMSDDPAQEFFSDGIAEELLNALARLRNLKVAARTSSFAFKGQQADIREIGKALNVDTVLEGSLRKSGKRLRITAQLIDVETGYHLWSETYDRELSDVFALQDDITAQIMSALHVHLEAGETGQVTSTTNTEAYEAYMRGRQALHERTLASIQHAQELFELATSLDPDFALAWSGQGLAIHLQSESNYGNLGREETFLRNGELINRALALDPELAEAHAVRGLEYMEQWRYEEGLVALDRAIAINPGTAEFHLWRSGALQALGQVKESNEALDRAFQLDPLHPAILSNRVARACFSGWVPVTQSLFDSLDRYPGQQLAARAFCDFATGDLAQAYKSLSAQEGVFGYLLAQTRRLLKDCETPWQLGSDPKESAFPQALYCLGEKAAISAYDELSDAQKLDFGVRDYLSILQLRQGKYVDSLTTLDSLYRNGLANTDLYSNMTSGSNLQINRALALQRLDRNEEAMIILTNHRRILEQAKKDGMRHGYHLLEAKMALLLGDHDAGLRSLDAAFRGFEIGWHQRGDPVLLALVGKEKLAEMTQWLDVHIDAERAKLGWAPAAF